MQNMLAAEKKEAERQLAAAHQTMQHLESQLQEKEAALAAASTVSCRRPRFMVSSQLLVCNCRALITMGTCIMHVGQAAC